MRASRSLLSVVRFYTRPNCGLCANAEYELEKAAERAKFGVLNIDITKPENEAHFDKYAFDVPVLHIAASESAEPAKVFMHRVTSDELVRAISAINEESE